MAAACGGGSLDHVFEKPEKSESHLSSPWKGIKSIKHNLEDSSFCELFGDLHFKDNNYHTCSSSVSPLPLPIQSLLSHQEEEISISSPDQIPSNYHYHHLPNRKQYRRDNNNSTTFSSSSMNSESLSLCTEGLGFESSDASFHFQDKIITSNIMCEEKSYSYSLKEESKRSRMSTSTSTSSKGGRSFPPPISCIGKTGKPWVSFKSYRQDGRFILEETRIPIQETLHASRQDGRLKLHFIQSESESDDDELLLQQGDVCDFGCEENGDIDDGEKEEQEFCS